MAEKQFANQKTSTSSKPDKPTSNPFSSLIYKIVFVFVLVALLPIFPTSQSLEFVNNSFLARSWELLHLLVVGIAISYGLFSSKNSDHHDIEKEALPKPDVPQSYISQMLQVSSVFDDDEEDIKGPTRGLDFTNDSKNQTWNYSQYYREEPMVMVAKENDDDVNTNTKPLFLPIRGLKAYDHEANESSKICRSGGKENLVLPSPIPWRSRSGKMDLKEESSRPNSPINSKIENEQGYSRTSSLNEPRENMNKDVGSSRNLYVQETKGGKMKEEIGNLRNLSFQETREKTNEEVKCSRSRSTNESLLQEMRGKTNEDSGRKKNFQKSYIPPPPPPPPMPHYYSTHFSSKKKYATKSFRDELDGLRKNKDDSSNSISLEKNSCNGRSVRTVRPPLHKREKKDEFREKMIIESESESERENSDLSDVEEPTTASTSKEEKQEENEVDKKADEFIAKFREQIRLQRIASIKKSSGQRSTRSSK